MSADKDVIKTYNSEWMGASGTSNHRKVSPLLPNDYDDNIYLIKRTTDDNNKSNGSSVWVNPPLLRVPNERGVMEELNWMQRSPYNMYCPVKGGEKTIAGCVAIAMAQVMRYWEWPPGYCWNTLSVNKKYATPLLLYAWDKMPAAVYSENTEEAKWIASLIRHCGESVSMDYGTSSSSADPKYVPGALINYFEYSWNIEYARCHNTRSSESKNEQRIYYNLIAGRPVIAGGNKKFFSTGGHCFIIDGVAPKGEPVSKDYYHVNWGWGMQHDKRVNFWCRIDNFDTQRFGSYNFWNEFIFDIYPKWMDTRTPIAIRKETLKKGFHITNRYSIHLENVKVPSNAHGYIVSGDYVYLGPGCRFEPGCEVYIGAREMTDPRYREGRMNKIRVKYDRPVIEEATSDTVTNYYASTLLRTNAKLVQPSSNPNILVLSCEDGIKETYVYSVGGQFIKRVSSGGVGFLDYDPVQQEIDITELSTGVYLVVVLTMGGHRLQDRFVKR